MRTVSSRARSGSRRLTIALMVGLAVVGMAVVFTWRDLAAVRGELSSASKRLQAVVSDTSGFGSDAGRDHARREIDVALDQVAGARRRAARSPFLRLARVVPGIGTQRAGLLRLVDDATAGAKSGRRLLEQVDTLADDLSITDGRVPLAALAELEAGVRATVTEIRSLDADPAGLWWPVRGSRTRFNEVVGDGERRLAEAADTLAITRSFMGEGGSRRHLVALQNNAEMRDQGMVLSYLTIRFSDGTVALEQGGSVEDLKLDAPVSTPIPDDTARLFAPLKPNQLWQSVNATPTFSVSGRLMSDMYRAATGESVDGVIGIDVPALAAILKVVGPVMLEGVAEPITSDSLGRIVLHDLYETSDRDRDHEARRERLNELAASVFSRLFGSGVDTVVLGRELGQAAAGGHLRLWSTESGEEEVFARQGLGGGPAEVDADRTFHFAVENRTANKVDYYVRPRVRQQVKVEASGDAVVRTTVSVANGAPVGAPPSYQLSSTLANFAPGDYMAWVLVWSPLGSTDRYGGVPESGLVVSHAVTDVSAGTTKELTFETTVHGAVRGGRLELRYVPQPRLEPVTLEILVEADGWDVTGDRSWSGPLDRVRSLSWELKRS